MKLPPEIIFQDTSHWSQWKRMIDLSLQIESFQEKFFFIVCQCLYANPWVSVLGKLIIKIPNNGWHPLWWRYRRKLIKSFWERCCFLLRLGSVWSSMRTHLLAPTEIQQKINTKFESNLRHFPANKISSSTNKQFFVAENLWFSKLQTSPAAFWFHCAALV